MITRKQQEILIKNLEAKVSDLENSLEERVLRFMAENMQCYDLMLQCTFEYIQEKYGNEELAPLMIHLKESMVALKKELDDAK